MDRATMERMRAWGASDEVLARAQQDMVDADAAEDYALWPENWDLWGLFMQVCAMWERTGMDGRRVYLNWPGIAVVARGLGWRGKAWAEAVQGLLLVQDAVLAVDAKQQATRGNGA